MTGVQAVTVLLEDRLITFTRAVGLVRRRNMSVRSISVGPTAAPGVSRLTIMINSDEAAAARAVQHLDKVVGVRAAATFPARDGVSREIALVKVRAHRTVLHSSSTSFSSTTPRWWMTPPTRSSSS